MSIRSLDMQVLLPRAQEVSRTQQIQLQNPQTQQQEFAAQLQQLTSRQQSAVQSSPKGESAQINDQNNSGGRKQPKGRSRKNKSNDTPADLSEPNLGHMIDIKI